MRRRHLPAFNRVRPNRRSLRQPGAPQMRAPKRRRPAQQRRTQPLRPLARCYGERIMSERQQPFPDPLPEPLPAIAALPGLIRIRPLHQALARRLLQPLRLLQQRRREWRQSSRCRRPNRSAARSRCRGIGQPSLRRRRAGRPVERVAARPAERVAGRCPCREAVHPGPLRRRPSRSPILAVMSPA
jgi:hypothetical protein